MTDLLQQAWTVRMISWPEEIGFDFPSRTLPISVTGAVCALDCAHCGGHYLQHMVPIDRVADDRRLHGASSLLISGGCDHMGRVSVADHLATITSLRSGRRLNWHVGLLDDTDLDAIRPYVDAVSFDFVGDDDTIREVYGLDRRVNDYVACYERLRSSVPVVPHVTIGLHGGHIRGERRSLQLLRDAGLDALVFLVFVPTPGTRYATCRAPDVTEVANLLAEARIMLPSTPIALGCMRPGASYRSRLDPLAIRAGVNRVVNPAASAARAATELGLSIVRRYECCVF